MKILVLNGPNLGMLGTREPEIYGRETLDSIMERVKTHAASRGVEIAHLQSDAEGALVAAIARARKTCNAIVINPAAFTHTSVALHDALLACGLPAVEVHLSNVYKREGYRHESLTASACTGQITGFGAYGYIMAVDALAEAAGGGK